MSDNNIELKLTSSSSSYYRDAKSSEECETEETETATVVTQDLEQQRLDRLVIREPRNLLSSIANEAPNAVFGKQQHKERENKNRNGAQNNNDQDDTTGILCCCNANKNCMNTTSIGDLLRFLHLGYDEKRHLNPVDRNLAPLAKLLIMLRQYYELYGLPQEGGYSDQKFVICFMMKSLYQGGVPLWVLEPAMKTFARGLTGKSSTFLLLPNKALVTIGDHTVLIDYARDFNFSILEGASHLFLRVASYASNTSGVENLPTNPIEGLASVVVMEEESARRRQDMMNGKMTTRSNAFNHNNDEDMDDQMKLAAAILNLASKEEGLFSLVPPEESHHGKAHDGHTTSNRHRHDTRQQEHNNKRDDDDDDDDDVDVEVSLNDSSLPFFWAVEDHIVELFRRLATMDAITRIDEFEKSKKVLYSDHARTVCNFLVGGGTAGFWYSGGWIDVVLAGVCCAIVGYVSRWRLLSKQKRLLLEAVASLCVGVVGGVVSMLLPEQTCLHAIGIAGVINLMQGFRLSFSVIEVMAKHAVAGGADFLLAIMTTTLIAWFLKAGANIAKAIVEPDTDDYLQCNNPVREIYYLALVPLAAVSWVVIWNPEYRDVPLMVLHGILAYVVAWATARANWDNNFSLFISAFAVTFSAGLVSRFNGRQGLGNTSAGLFALVPGSYLVKSLLADSSSLDFLTTAFANSALIGLGAWSGTIVVSPSMLGGSADLLKRQLVRHLGNKNLNRIGRHFGDKDMMSESGPSGNEYTAFLF